MARGNKGKTKKGRRKGENGMKKNEFLLNSPQMFAFLLKILLMANKKESLVVNGSKDILL